jgi:hypothetical protein
VQELANAYGGGHVNLNGQDDVHHLLYGGLGLQPPEGWRKKSNVFGKHEEKSKTVLGPTTTPWLEAMTDLSPAVKGATCVCAVHATHSLPPWTMNHQSLHCARLIKPSPPPFHRALQLCWSGVG